MLAMHTTRLTLTEMWFLFYYLLYAVRFSVFVFLSFSKRLNLEVLKNLKLGIHYFEGFACFETFETM